MRIGQILAERFVLERLAGRGGMGEVYRALDRDTGQSVAIKVLYGQPGSDVARFEREARILAGLDHPLVVRYVAHGALPTGEPYLAMEWLDGEDLAARLARERLDVVEGVALAVRVAEALAALHERGIVHRDLKPSNIFLVDGHLDAIRLVDFGLARSDTATRMTDAGTLLGTVAYMAPEQARGADGLDARADVFALGCLLFECLTGQTPFAAMHATAVLTKILFEDTPRLRQRLPGAPEALDALLERMLAKQPHERPRDGRAAAEALRALGTPALVPVAVEDTVELPRTPAITDSEQRAVVVLLIAAPATAAPVVVDAAEMQVSLLRREDMDALGTVAAEHGGRLQWLLDGSAAVLLSSTQIATDLAAQAARCALALGRHATGRRIALAIGRSELAGPQPVGPAIDRAARLLGIEPAPDPGAQRALILLDDASVGLLDARFDVQDEGGIVLLMGERDSAEVRTLLGKATPCVGRERELRMLEALFEDCVENGHAHATVVTAPPGVGKSRLGREFLAHIRARSEPTAVWIARGEALRAGSPFALLAGLVQSASGLRGGESLEERRDKLSARVAEHLAGPERQRVAQFLGEVVGAAFPDDLSPPLQAARRDAQLMSDQISTAFLDFLAAECKVQPVLLVIEDLHWGDGPTVRLLDMALRALEEAPLFVLGLARPEVHDLFPRLWDGRPVQEISLRALPAKAAERLVRHMLGDRTAAETIERIVRLSEGNAFYLEELIRWAAQGKVDDLPETVIAMVQSRLGALDDESRRILRAASIFGETFWPGGVAALLGDMTMSVADMSARLAALVDQELILEQRESRVRGEREYSFRHALVREGAYSMLTSEDLVLGHRLAGDWLERHGENDTLVLAEHFEKGGDDTRAARQWLRVWQRGNWGGDTPRAITYIERALAGPMPREVRLQILGALCELNHYRIEKSEAALPHAEELLGEVESGSVPWAQALVVKLNYLAQAGKTEDFAAALGELMAAEMEPEAVHIAVLPLGIGCYLLGLAGHIQQADAVHERVEAIVRSATSHATPSIVPGMLLPGIRAYASDDPWAALIHCRIGLAQSEIIGHRRYFFIARVLLALNTWFLGAYNEARHLVNEVTLPDDELGHVSSMRPFMLAWILSDQGDFGKACECARSFILSGQARRLPMDQGRGHWVLAEALRRRGDFAAAETEIHAALALIGATCPLDHPGALATLAALRRDQGHVDEALAAAEEGMARYESMAACSLFFRGAFLRLVHAECLDATGNHEAAKAAIANARERLLVIADKIGDPEYRKSFLDNVPENRRTLELARQWLGGQAGSEHVT